MSDLPKKGRHVEPGRLADLAAASRILADHGVVDGFGHVSMRHPDAPDRFLMSRSLAPALVTPADIQEYDLDCTPTRKDAANGFLERFIHGEIYKVRPDIHSIVHSHSPSVIPFSLVRQSMRAMFHNAAFLATEVPVFDIAEEFGPTDMLVCDCPKGAALARTLGRRDVALMRAHGSVACGPTLEIAVFRAVYTEVNARIQHWTHSLCSKGAIAALTPQEGDLADGPNRTAGMRAWDLWRTQARDRYGW
ncbi:HCOMODA/2-hydroxy-3-carboxy-muconic semialdehyde decarboxylase [Pseudorhizobium tarimense]|uniref:HCOMODA/2-hydroxy-3-carboxy-muconic semialdehyde decarboxylase n=1 Tax=Pseudorhizobium tarimense TaxID=1079109 RepID=A0ABV2HBW1_9HYPH|nr:class II aldolase/adducin family protein [Pseudorhizobium tarimense]MCJ8520946.1 class II aldolase/adducin family protein [Pseudorhizobium tarimense]